MKQLLRHFLSLALMLGVVAAPLTLAVASPASALDPKTEICSGVTGAGGTGCGANGTSTFSAFIRKIINILLFVVGAIAVLVIIIGGLRYVLSGGDQSAVNSAKNTILYAVIGLIVAIMAYAIVNFVVGAL